MLIIACFIILVGSISASCLNKLDQPCAARREGESVVCVCNSTFCDSIIRENVRPDRYHAYTTSKDGLRFHKTTGKLRKRWHDNATGVVNLVLSPDKTFGTIEGFGGAVTDSAAMNWKNLTGFAKKYLVDCYFSPYGLEYNMLRIPIGGTDFSTHPYALNELPVNDTTLSNFTLASEDYLYKLPMIKACMESATDEVHIVASLWSPPTWMKTSNSLVGQGSLKEEYYQTLADYHIRFLEKYAEQNVSIWAITATNEPTDGYMIPPVPINCLGWNASTMAKFMVRNLGPTLRKSEFNNTLILALDDQRYNIPTFLNYMLKYDKNVVNWFDGIAVHFYGDSFTSPCLLSQAFHDFPGKFIISTEGCAGAFPWLKEPKVILGSWTRAETYIKSIIEDLTHHVSGWIDWNLCLNPDGGPSWPDNRVDSPIIVFAEKNEFVKQPTFYAMGHFSKFVPRGSVVIGVYQDDDPDVKSVAFKTTRETIVVVVFNEGCAKRVRIVERSEVMLDLPAKSITTVELKQDYEDTADVKIAYNSNKKTECRGCT